VFTFVTEKFTATTANLVFFWRLQGGTTSTNPHGWTKWTTSSLEFCAIKIRIPSSDPSIRLICSSPYKPPPFQINRFEWPVRVGGFRVLSIHGVWFKGGHLSRFCMGTPCPYVSKVANKTTNRLQDPKLRKRTALRGHEESPAISPI
jgi:hypothetical protein